MSILCLVPSALHAARATRRLCDAGDGVLLDGRVSTLDALAGALLAATGGRPVLPPLGERLLVAELAAAAPRFAGADPAGGLARSLAAAVAELRRAEVRAADVRAASAACAGRPAERLAAIAAVLEEYERRLDDRGLLDGAAAIRAAAEALRRQGDVEPLRDLDVLVVDGFGALTPAALDLTLALAGRARATQLRIPYFAARPDVSAAAEPLLRRAEALGHVGHGQRLEVVLEDDDGATRAPRLSAIVRGVFGAAAPRPAPPAPAREAGLVLSAAGAGEEGEAEVVAGTLAMLLDRGFAPDDVAVVAPSARAAERLGLAAAALAVPFTGAPALPLADEPPVRALRAALAAAVDPSRSALEALLSSPYLALGRPPARLGFWLDRAGAEDGRGDPAGALRGRAASLTGPVAARERSALVRAAEALERAAAALRPLGSAGSAGEHAARMRGFLATSGIRRRAGRGEAALARRDLESLRRFADATDAIVRAQALLGSRDEALDARRWAKLLDLATELAPGPPPREGARGVELWPLSDAPGLSARAVVVSGCARGAFPQGARVDALLGDAERSALNAVVRRPALALAATRAAEARHAAFCALAAPREALCLTWPGPGPDGPGVGPAPLAIEALALAGVDADAKAPAATRRSALQALHAAARATRSGAAAAEAAARDLPPALAARATSAVARGRIEAERAEATAARTATRYAGAIPGALSADLQALLPREWTPSQLEEHARCPFRFLLHGLLAVGEPEEGDVDIDPRDEGSLAHAVLERFHRRAIAAGGLPLRGVPRERATLAAVAAEVFAAFEADGRTGDAAVWSARRAAVLRRLERVLAAEAGAGDAAIPVLVEHRFGGAAAAPALEFPDGDDVVRVRGRIDRVDASADRVVVVDYKDSRAAAPWRKKLAREALGDLEFQLPAYVMAAARALPGRTLLGGTYLLLRSAERLDPFTADAADPLFAVDAPARAAAAERGERPFADAVVGAVRRIRSGHFAIASRDCGRCPFGAVCRFEARAEEEP